MANSADSREQKIAFLQLLIFSFCRVESMRGAGLKGKENNNGF
jgi:hypothetical protein